MAGTGKRGEYTPQTLAIMAEGPKLRAQGMTYREIGVRFGVTEQWVMQVMHRAERAAGEAAQRRGEIVPVPPSSRPMARVARPDRDPDKMRQMRGMVGRRRVIIDGEEFVEVRPSKGRRTGEATFISRLPLQEAQQAARLSKSALIVWMELQHQCHRKQVQLVTLPVAELAEWGIDRQSRYNAAKQLVAAGLIHTVPKAPGQATLYGLGPAPKPRKQRASGRKEAVRPIDD